MTTTFIYNTKASGIELDQVTSAIKPIAGQVSTSWYDGQQSITAKNGSTDRLVEAVTNAGFNVKPDNSSASFVMRAASKTPVTHFVITG